MSAPTTRKATTMNRMLPLLAAAAGSLLAAAAQAAAPGISGTTFNLSATPAYLTQPDGQAVYSWGYGCTGGALAAGQSFVPATTTTPFCTTMQIPGPTLVVTEGQSVTVVLTNNLPASAGSTSMLFPGFTLTSACPAANQGLLTCEAAPGGTVTYTFTASSPGTRAYYSGTQGDLQVEMGLYGAIIDLPSGTAPTNGSCPFHNNAALPPNSTGTSLGAGTERDFGRSPTGAAYHRTQSCY